MAPTSSSGMTMNTERGTAGTGWIRSTSAAQAAEASATEIRIFCRSGRLA